MAERFIPRTSSLAIPPGSTGIETISLNASGVDELHELRVRIPVDLHRQLLSLKVLRGRSLADTVSLALDIYFSQVKSAPPRAELDEKTDAPAHS